MRAILVVWVVAFAGCDKPDHRPPRSKQATPTWWCAGRVGDAAMTSCARGLAKCEEARSTMTPKHWKPCQRHRGGVWCITVAGEANTTFCSHTAAACKRWRLFGAKGLWGTCAATH